MTKLHDSLKDVRLHSDGILGSTLPRFGLSYSHQGGCHNNWTVKYMFTMQKLNECEYQSVWTWKPFNHLNLRYSKTATMSSALTNAQIETQVEGFVPKTPELKYGLSHSYLYDHGSF